MQTPRRSGIDDIAQTTQSYLDFYIALELLHCTYGEYMARTSKLERLANQFYVMLRSLKEEHAQEATEREAEAQRSMANPMMQGRQ